MHEEINTQKLIKELESLLFFARNNLVKCFALTVIEPSGQVLERVQMTGEDIIAMAGAVGVLHHHILERAQKPEYSSEQVIDDNPA